MARTYLVRGMLAGLVAGLCAVAFAKAVAEPQIARAERFERAVDAQLHRSTVAPVVSRDVQDTVGLGTGVALAGVALGGMFGLTFAALYRRISLASAGVTASLLAAAGFAGAFLVPFLKYPANPPSIGSPDTLARRTDLYFLSVAVGLLSVVLGVLVARRLAERVDRWSAVVIAAGVFVAVVGLSYAAMPGIDEVPFGFPASVLWRFRLASLGTSLTLWAVLGVLFGALTERSERRVREEGRPVASLSRG